VLLAGGLALPRTVSAPVHTRAAGDVPGTFAFCTALQLAVLKAHAVPLRAESDVVDPASGHVWPSVDVYATTAPSADGCEDFTASNADDAVYAPIGGHWACYATCVSVLAAESSPDASDSQSVSSFAASPHDAWDAPIEPGVAQATHQLAVSSTAALLARVGLLPSEPSEPSLPAKPDLRAKLCVALRPRFPEDAALLQTWLEGPPDREDVGKSLSAALAASELAVAAVRLATPQEVVGCCGAGLSEARLRALNARPPPAVVVTLARMTANAASAAANAAQRFAPCDLAERNGATAKQIE
jgi:hypothetical protein